MPFRTVYRKKSITKKGQKYTSKSHAPIPSIKLKNESMAPIMGGDYTEAEVHVTWDCTS